MTIIMITKFTVNSYFLWYLFKHYKKTQITMGEGGGSKPNELKVEKIHTYVAKPIFFASTIAR